MPHKEKPMKQHPEVEDESTGNSNELQGSKRESGEPGGGVGRRDEVGGSGVYPPGVAVPEGAEIRMAGEWAQKLGGEVGGSSELNPYEVGLSDSEMEKLAKEEEEEP